MEYIHFANGKSYLLRESNPPKNMNKDEKIQQPESRIKELENNTTELIKRSGDITHDYWYYCQECLHNFEIDEEFNFCPNCGRKIVR